MDAKRIISGYLNKHRQALLAKLDGVGEREVRWPMTPTGTNLLGLVKHVATVELGYFGEVFDRPSDIPLLWLDEDAEINADMWATAQESRDEIVSLYMRAAAHADATIEALALDSPGRVPWWPPEREQVTLQQIMVHVTVEIARHAGHADIIRELIDGNAGDNDGNLPDQTTQEWANYRVRLEQAAAEAAQRVDDRKPSQPVTRYRGASPRSAGYTSGQECCRTDRRLRL